MTSDKCNAGFSNIDFYTYILHHFTANLDKPDCVWVFFSFAING